MDYSIKDTTLIALGDAIRNKKLGFTETVINSSFSLYYVYDGESLYEEFNTHGVKTKIKINSIVPSRGGTYEPNTGSKLCNIGIILNGGYNKVPDKSEASIIIEPGVVLPYETIVDSSAVTFLFMGSNSDESLNLDVELIALDENGEVNILH